MLAVGPVDGEIQGWKVEFTLFTKYSTNFLCPDIIHTQTHLDIHTQTHLDTHTHTKILYMNKKKLRVKVKWWQAALCSMLWKIEMGMFPEGNCSWKCRLIEKFNVSMSCYCFTTKGVTYVGCFYKIKEKQDHNSIVIRNIVKNEMHPFYIKLIMVYGWLFLIVFSVCGNNTWQKYNLKLCLMWIGLKDQNSFDVI